MNLKRTCKILLAFLYLLTTSDLFAQESFIKGAIITLENDTIKGLIDFQSQGLNSTECKFRKTTNSKISTFLPKELNGYFFTNGRTYISKKPTLLGVEKQLFLEYLIKGDVNLYVTKYQFEENFIIEKNEILKELKLKAVREQKDGKILTGEKKEYLGVLNWAFSGTPNVEIQSRIKKTILASESLVKTVSLYHELNGFPFHNYFQSAKREKKKISISLGLEAGVSSSKLTITPRYTDGPIVETFTADFSESRLARLYNNSQNSTNLPRISESTNVTLGLGVNVNRDGTLSFETGVYGLMHNSSGFEFFQVQIPMLVQLEFLRNKKVTPFGQLGVVNHFTSNIKNKESYQLQSTQIEGLEPESFDRIYSPIVRDLGDDFLSLRFRIGTSFGGGLKLRLNEHYIQVKYHFTTVWYGAQDKGLNLEPYVDSNVRSSYSVISLGYFYRLF